MGCIIKERDIHLYIYTHVTCYVRDSNVHVYWFHALFESVLVLLIVHCGHEKTIASLFGDFTHICACFHLKNFGPNVTSLQLLWFCQLYSPAPSGSTVPWCCICIINVALCFIHSCKTLALASLSPSRCVPPELLISHHCVIYMWSVRTTQNWRSN